MDYIYGPVPSRRLGISLGVSPIPKKTCNYSCVYCQLGRTDHMTNQRQDFFELSDMIEEFEGFLKKNIDFDVVTIVGEGEPTLYLSLGKLIKEIKKRTDKPVAIITNGGLLYDDDVKKDLYEADICMPTLDAYDQASFKKINRPIGNMHYDDVYRGLVEFSRNYKNQLWLEMMFVKGMNDDNTSISKLKEKLKDINYQRLYINTVVRPPAEEDVDKVSHKDLNSIAKSLGGLSIDVLMSDGFYSEIKDDFEAIKSIIKRHPMNHFEIKGFLEKRGHKDKSLVFKQLEDSSEIDILNNNGYKTYRLK
jgi:wyosine [tRNA(Phe)-imidazoG37] synthetase (radical SAM superfamily)